MAEENGFNWSGLSAGVSAGSGLFGGITSLFRGRAYQRKLMEDQAKIQYKYSQMAADEAARRNREAFDYEAAYNSPSASRRRLEEAGLLGASLFEGSAPGAPSMTAPDTPGSDVSIPPAVSPEAAGFDQISGSMLRAAQIANINADTNVKNEQVGNVSADTAYKQVLTSLNAVNIKDRKLDVSLKKISLALKDATFGDSVENIKLANSQLRSTIAKLTSEQSYIEKQIGRYDEHMDAVISNINIQSFESLWRCSEIESMINLNNANTKYVKELTRSAIVDADSAEAAFAIMFSPRFDDNGHEQPSWFETLRQCEVWAGLSESDMAACEAFFMQIKQAYVENGLKRDKNGNIVSMSKGVEYVITGSNSWSRFAPVGMAAAGLLAAGGGVFSKALAGSAAKGPVGFRYGGR